MPTAKLFVGCRRQTAGPLDLLIAAHALAEGCTLVTAELAFAQVAGLVVKDFAWDA